MAAEIIECEVDLARTASPFSHYQEVCVGSGHAALALRADWQAQLWKCHQELGFCYVRFHGRNKAHWFRQESGRNQRYDYLYSEDELKPWIEKVQQMKRKVNDLFIVTNNHYRGQAVVNAIEIQAALGYAKYRPPSHLVDAYPHLRRLFQEAPTEA